MSEAGLLADPAEVRAILVASAQAGQPISYSEVLGLLGHHFSRPKMRQLCKVLGYVDDEAEAARPGLVDRRREEAWLHRSMGRPEGRAADPENPAAGV